jgi:hypothetical protein
MLRGLLHAIPKDPSLLHNNLNEISKIVVAPLNIFIHVIPEDGPYWPKHVVSIIRA